MTAPVLEIFETSPPSLFVTPEPPPSVEVRESVEIRTLIIEEENPTILRIEIPNESVEVRRDVDVTLEVEPISPPNLVISDPTSVRLPPPSSFEKRIDWTFSSSRKVPANSVLYLDVDGVSTLAAPVVLPRAARLVALSVLVDVPDPTRSYTLELLANGSLVATLSLPTSTKKASDASFSIPLSADSEIAARLSLDSGTGSSSFRNVSATVEFSA